ncbi:hypothetical protein C5167_045384 [Papaver somniferum]|uniref:Uncharacterized protein n=1 Tax=Papaver somniferum TaxID=3469 RepID=A0A4Y7LDG7_PAPSO|nr:hypothetical protein C5167_045384 [Papaver somniferum]
MSAYPTGVGIMSACRRAFVKLTPDAGRWYNVRLDGALGLVHLGWWPM